MVRAYDFLSFNHFEDIEDSQIMEIIFFRRGENTLCNK